ncbi:MAG TPA: class I SAM-dependent methyltransferase [Bacteroidota bacterium]|nr:class I SAM-dependent methyltransferase [Bacteroidota bacterium]
MKHRDLVRIITKVCSLQPGSRILETGCGSGRDILYFAASGYACTAVDINVAWLTQLERAKRVMDRNITLETLGADFFSLPFADETFDLVFNSGVIEHYEQLTRGAVLAEMMRVTRKGGYVCCAFPNKEHVLESVWETMIGCTSDHDKYDIPEQNITPSILTEFHSVGLGPVLIDWIDCYDTISRYPSWLPLRTISFAANALLPRIPKRFRRKLGTRVLVVAQRTKQ